MVNAVESENWSVVLVIICERTMVSAEVPVADVIVQIGGTLKESRLFERLPFMSHERRPFLDKRVISRP